MNKNPLELVEPRWRAAFLDFVETGAGSEDFLRFLESDRLALRAAELISDWQIDELGALAASVVALCEARSEE